MKIIKFAIFLILFICWGLSYQQNLNGSLRVKLVSGSTFKDSQLLIDGSYETAAELSFPDELNQFLIFDMNRQVSVKKILIYVKNKGSLIARDVEVLIGKNVIGWEKLKSKVQLNNSIITIKTEGESGRYLRLNLSKQHYYEPLRIREIEIFIDQPQQQVIYDVSVPEDRITTSSAVIKYRTKTAAASYLLYGNNFDFIYEGKITEVYSDLEMKKNHQIVIRELMPGTTYVFRIGITDEQGNKKLSKYHYLSTRRSGQNEN
jgi:hypothetical protein